MIPEPIDDAVLERYVLGRLEGNALNDIECWLLSTPDAPALVDAIELELAERYLDGELPPTDRADFARALRARPGLASRLALVEGLRVRARANASAKHDAGAVTAPLPFARRERASWTRSTWMPASMAAGFIAAAGLAAWLQVERTRLESEVRRLQAQVAAPAAPAPGTTVKPPIASALQPPAAAAVVAVTLSAGVTRSATPPPLVTTRPDTQLVRLELRVPAGTGPMRALLVDGDLVERLELGPLVALPDGPATHVPLDVPASAIPSGDYVITLRPANGRPSPTFTYTFRVAALR